MTEVSSALKTTQWHGGKCPAHYVIKREFPETPEKFRIHVLLVNWRHGQKFREVMFSPGKHRNMYLGTQRHRCLIGGSSLEARTSMYWRDMPVENTTCKERFQNWDLFSLDRRRLSKDNQAFLPCIKGCFRDYINHGSPVAQRAGQGKKHGSICSRKDLGYLFRGHAE